MNLNNYLNLLSLVTMGFVAFYVVRSKVKDENYNDLKDRVALLEKEREEAREQHIENQKAIANLEGQLQTYKEIPLRGIDSSLKELTLSNQEILNTLKKSATSLAKDNESVSKAVKQVKTDLAFKG